MLSPVSTVIVAKDPSQTVCFSYFLSSSEERVSERGKSSVCVSGRWVPPSSQPAKTCCAHLGQGKKGKEAKLA